jgi:hypothetical protein
VILAKLEAGLTAQRIYQDLVAEHNAFLLEWETAVADVRIHGTTKRRPIDLFEEFERAALLPLPGERFPFFHEAERAVHRDGHVEVAKAYYSVPPECVGRRVWVRWDSRMVRVLNRRFEEIAVHVRREAGRFSTDPFHIPSEKVSIIERGAEHLLKRASLVGGHAQRWAEAVVKSRGAPGMRTIQGLLALARRHTSAQIDRACELAVKSGAYRLRNIRALIGSTEEQTELFVSEHPVIRNMNEYGRIVKVVLGEGRADMVPISARPGLSGRTPVEPDLRRPRPLRGEAGADGLGHRKGGVQGE